MREIALFDPCADQHWLDNKKGSENTWKRNSYPSSNAMDQPSTVPMSLVSHNRASAQKCPKVALSAKLQERTSMTY